MVLRRIAVAASLILPAISIAGTQPREVAGVVFIDANENGVRDTGERAFRIFDFGGLLAVVALARLSWRDPLGSSIAAALDHRATAATLMRTLLCWLLLPAAAAYAQAHAAAPLVIGETFTIDSKTLAETRRINVYLPPVYTASAATRFPVLYMPDGGMAEDFLHVAGLVQVSVGNGTMRPFILVGIENTERRRDLTGPTRVDADRTIAPRVGGSAAFRTFIRSELMPAVTSRYRTTAETAIMGESLAGLFVVETLLLEPALFDTYIAIDPSLWWNGNELVTSAEKRSGSIAGPRTKTLYLASSGDDREHLTRQLAGLLEKSARATLKVHYQPMPGETHATIYHPAALAAIRLLFKD
jgi:predicted alpha/beta superfamily hydrolase